VNASAFVDGLAKSLIIGSYSSGVRIPLNILSLDVSMVMTDEPHNQKPIS
jgi:hypothetical protein